MGTGKLFIIDSIDGQKRDILNRFSKFLKKDGNHAIQLIDATIVKAHQHAAGARDGQESQALGQSRGGFSTKIHAKVDGYGKPITLELTAGQVHETQAADLLIANSDCCFVIADKGYDSDLLRDELIKAGIEPVIPGKSNRVVDIYYDKELYKERNIVERFFNRIKQFRRIATRYDKTAVMFMGALTLVAILIWLKL